MKSRGKKGALDHYFGCWGKYAVFGGRAGTDEFWGFFGVNLAVNVLLNVLSRTSSGGLSFLSTLYGLAVFLPTASLGVRRFHDCGRGGWAYWCYFVPMLVGLTLGGVAMRLPGNQEQLGAFCLCAGAVGLVLGLLLLVNLSVRGEAGTNVYGENPEPWNAVRCEREKKSLAAQFSMCVDGYRKYAVFSGRASRSEFWGFFGLNLVGLCVVWFGMSFVRDYLMESLPSGFIMMGCLLALFVPMVSAGVRRFHDCNRTLGDYLCYGVPLWVSVAIVLLGRLLPGALVFAAAIISVLMLALFIRALASDRGSDSDNRYGRVVE